MHQRGDEHRLARARQPGDAEAQRGIDEALAEIGEVLRRNQHVIRQ